MIETRGWSIALAVCATIASGRFVPTEISRGHDVAQCDHVQYFLPVPTEHARPFLPPGFAPTDAARFESRPGWDGKTLAHLDVVVCGESEIEPGPFAGSTLALAVERPQVADEFDVSRVEHQFYTIVYSTDGAEQLAGLSRTGYHAVEAQVRIEPATQGLSQRSEVIGDWSEIRTPARLTHEGAPSSCSFQDGSPAQQVIGDGDGDASEDAVVQVPDQAWDGVFHNRPSGHVLAPAPSMDG